MEARLQQHKKDVLASNLLFGSLALTMAMALIRHHVLPAGNQASDARFTGGLAVVALLYSGLFYAIRRGHYWAKVMLLLLFLLALLGAVITYQTTFSPKNLDPLNVASTLVHYGVRVWVLLLLFRQPGSQKT
ncbi:MAG: hypothetical protein H7Z21_07500 [Hymenobacter sp.]|nr:hypothetical protein [Hymenobacter sp.]